MSVDVLTEIVIDRPLAEVAAYATDPTNAPEWYVNIHSVEWRTPPPATTGSAVAFVARFMGRRLEYNDPLRFQPEWLDRFSHATQITVARGYHFPMCDNPELVAATIDEWHRTNAILDR